MKEPFVLHEASRPDLDLTFIFSPTGIWGSAPGLHFVFQSSWRWISRRRRFIVFDALILDGIFVVYVVALIWVKEGGDNKGVEKTT